MSTAPCRPARRPRPVRRRSARKASKMTRSSASRGPCPSRAKAPEAHAVVRVRAWPRQPRRRCRRSSARPPLCSVTRSSHITSALNRNHPSGRDAEAMPKTREPGSAVRPRRPRRRPVCWNLGMSILQIGQPRHLEELRVSRPRRPRLVSIIGPPFTDAIRWVSTPRDCTPTARRISSNHRGRTQDVRY